MQGGALGVSAYTPATGVQPWPGRSVALRSTPESEKEGRKSARRDLPGNTELEDKGGEAQKFWRRGKGSKSHGLWKWPLNTMGELLCFSGTQVSVKCRSLQDSKPLVIGQRPLPLTLTPTPKELCCPGRSPCIAPRQPARVLGERRAHGRRQGAPANPPPESSAGLRPWGAASRWWAVVAGLAQAS